MPPRQVEHHDLPRVRVEPVVEGPGHNRILGVCGAREGIRGVWRGFEHLIIPSLVEEGLSDMQNAAGVRDERAGSKDQFRFSIIKDALGTNPLAD